MIRICTRNAACARRAMTFLLARAIALAILLGGIASGVSAQQDYPNRPIRFLVGVVPGGATDILARVIGQRLGEGWNQQVVVDNRPGANQIIAAELTAKAAPDGYTLQMVPAGFAINPAMHRKLPYDPIRDFTPISMVADVPNVMVVHPSIPVKTVGDFVTYARARPGQLSYGSSGVGSPSHLCGELLAALARLQMTHVPYKGQGQVMIDVLGGHLKLAFPSIPASIPYIRNGRLVALGVASRKRSSSLPDVPTIDESGVKGYEASSWYGVLGPPRMPKPLLARLNGEINRIVQSSDIRQTLSQQGADPLGSTPEEFARQIAIDIEKWKKVVAQAGIKPE
ncbi:MAG TPA: tripartite tricarboxylate transporter substrate binding protein [Burkholderiales bacterium]|nr:tripartite tricarboxylate transporter substrate binding protein [Burkholderiales bacterium]